MRLSIVLVFTTLVAVSATSQEPVAIGGSLSIPVQVVSANGEPLEGITIEAISSSGQRFSATTNHDGKATVRLAEPGQYRVRATMEGMQTVEKTLSIGLGGSETLKLQMGPVPLSGGISVTPTSDRNCKVMTVAQTDDLRLQQLLNRRASAHCLLTAVVQVGPGKSYFCFRATQVASLAYTVIATTHNLNANELNRRIEAQSSQVLRGIHRVSNSTLLMVFTNE